MPPSDPAPEDSDLDLEPLLEHRSPADSADGRLQHPSASVTNWDVINAAAAGGPGSRAAIESILERLRPAVFAYLRRSGRDPEAAADLTQSFLCDVVLGGRLLEHADPRRGRFRTLLFTSLRNHVTDHHRHATRQRRHPGTPILSFDRLDRDRCDAESRSLPADPERAFAAAWARSIVMAALEEAREQCRVLGMAAHWTIFEGRVIRPMFDGSSTRSYDELMGQLWIDDAATAANMMVSAKRRFARSVRQQIHRTVADPAEVDQEIRELLADLGARP